MHEITINLDTLLWLAAGFGTICATAVWIKKSTAPFLNPIKQLKTDVKELKAKRLTCDQKFEHYQSEFAELKKDINMNMRSNLLILKHIETGNCTGEVAAGRKELEEYLITRK